MVLQGLWRRAFTSCFNLVSCSLNRKGWRFRFVFLPSGSKTNQVQRPVTTRLSVSSAGDVVDIYQREFLALRERLHSAEQENLRRSKELNLVLEEIKRAIAEKQALRDINRTWSSLSEETRLKLWNVSSSKNVLQLPSIFHHLPHLLNREDSLQPAVHLGQGRTGGKVRHTLITNFFLCAGSAMSEVYFYS
uniref:Uncharacterized protein n=1 Tax=Kryptolebias marmoratus TaxID=37003 RepID=A0A3Q3FRA0_KRYMA